MKKMKKCLSLFVSLLMLISLIQVPALAQGYDIDISVKSGGSRVYSIGGLTGFDVDVTVNNAPDAVDAAAILVAVYSSDGQTLKYVQKKDISIAESSSAQNFSDSISGLAGDAGQVCKVMVWNMATHAPLCAAYDPTKEAHDLTVTTDGTYELYNYVTASTKNAVGDVTYKWMYSDSEDGEYKELATETTIRTYGREIPNGETSEAFSLVSDNGATIRLLQGCDEMVVLEQPYVSASAGYEWPWTHFAKGKFDGEASVANKYVKVVATDEAGNTGESAPVKVGGTFGDTPTNGNLRNELGWSTEYDGTNDFTIDGKSFTLLDTDPHSRKSRYLVIANDTYGTISYNQGGQWFGTWAHHSMVQLPNPISSYVNEDLTFESGTHRLPQTIIDNIDYNHMWPYEARLNAADYNLYNMVIYSGVTLPSVAEITKYGKKIKGLGGADDPWFLTRSPSTTITNEENHMSIIFPAMVSYADGTVLGSTVYWNEGSVRPIFWVGENFFTNAKNSITSMGTNIEALVNATVSE